LWVCVCILALVIWHANRIFYAPPCYIIICGPSGSTRFFDIMLRTARFEHELCILIFCTTFIWNISHYKQNSVRYWRKSASVFLFLSGLTETRIFSTDFRNIFKHQISMKSVHRLPSSMCTDRRTVRHGEADSRFSELCECAKNRQLQIHILQINTKLRFIVWT
jgi:hypothetical protein